MSILAAAGLSAVGNATGSLLGYFSNKETNAQQMELAKYQHQSNVDMWNMNNAYNTPAQQMARLQQAGLNPNLVYGNGTVTGNSSSAPQGYQAPTLRPYTNFDTGISSGVSTFLAARANSASVDNLVEQNSLLKTQGDAMRQKMISEYLDQSKKIVDTARSSQDLKVAKELQKYTVDAAKEGVRKIQSDIRVNESNIDVNAVRIDNVATQTESEKLRQKYTEAQIANLNVATQKLAQDRDFSAFEQNLKEIGVYPNDNLIFRLLFRIFSKKGESVKESDDKNLNIVDLLAKYFFHR